MKSAALFEQADCCFTELYRNQEATNMNENSKVQMEPIKHTRVGVQVYDVLKKMILHREFKIAQKLNIHDIAEQLQVSRSPVKDAFNRLAQEELLEIKPNTGTFVKPLYLKEIGEVYDCRAVLEPWAAEQGIFSISDDAIADMDDLMEYGRKILTGASPETFEFEQYIGVGYRFHQGIVQSAGNGKLMKVYRSLHADMHITRISMTVEAKDLDKLIVSYKDVHKEHGKIFEKIKIRDAKGTGQLLQQHLLKEKVRTLEALKVWGDSI
jgi:GntR family transcriptional regulator, rspAB operon transcriptional repressor